MSGTCEGCNGDGGCPVHDPPTCKRCKSEYTMDWPHTEPTAYCDACAHAVAGELTADLATAIAERDALAETRAALTANLNALTVDVATMRAERDEARRALAEMWSAAWLLMWRAIGDSISADDWCNEWARCPSPEAFAEVTRERDALLDMARDISVYAATSARHGSERSMRDVLTMTANRARSFLLPKRAHGAGEAK